MSALDLASLADAKAWLGLTSAADDAVLAALITATSQAILADLGRTVAPQLVTDTFEGGGETSLALRHWPATMLIACAADGAALPLSLRPGQGGVALDPADAAPPGAMQRITFSGGRFARGTVTVTYRAGYEIIAEPATVPTAAPFTVQAQAPFGAWSADTGVACVAGDGGAPGPYTVAGGAYAFTAQAAGAAVALSYAYVPADLARAALDWVADRYSARNRIGQSARTLGGQETASFIVKAMPDAVDRLLRPYRRVAR